jgi:hypothetical protein
MLDTAVLSLLIETAFLNNSDTKAVEGPQLTALCDCIAEAVVEHILTSAVVTVSMAAGVTACGAGAGTCTGSSTGTIT